MTTVAPPPNPSLVAIILVIQARSGPRLVYHYPPSPSPRVASNLSEDHLSSYANSSDSDDQTTSASDEDVFSDGYAKGNTKAKRANVTDEEDEDSSTPGADEQRHGGWRVPWEHLLGLDANALERLLMPSDRSWHKRRFEVGFNELVFVGWPVFIREDGTWRKKRRKEKGSGNKAIAASVDEDPENLPKAEFDAQEALKHLDQTGIVPSASTDMETAGTDENREMTIFNVVFVLNPPILEYSLRVKEMYDHVVKKFARALKWEQGRANYVWQQSEIILKAKAEARHKRVSISALYATLQRTSSLANAIATVYDGISRSMIASATLTPSAPISLQIPPPTSTSVLPSSTEPPSARTQPGVWLTTATTDNLEEVASLDPSHSAMSLAKHFTLLLLDNESKILADISQSGGPLAAALAHYIRVSSPTKSFAKISALHSIPLADIQVLAKHLVDWRRARAIPPLHQRDIYIVSPNADMRKLSSAVKAYESTFPTLPSLPKMLQALSGTPRPYSSLIPSKDHKDRYFMILAWLLRGGWVTQLRTFAFVRVDSSVKTAVKEHTRVERNGNARADKSSSMEASHDTITPLNPSQRPSIISRVSSDVKSSTSSHMNIRMNSLVLQPARASPTESKWLEYIGDHLQDLVSADLPEDEVVELQRYWPAFTRYLNGLEALEKIPVREGLKRRLVWDLFLKMGLFEPLANEAESKKDTHRRIFVVFQHW